VESFLEQAANDPHVLAIKLTLYRTGSDTAIVRALSEAAEQGKQVAVLIELQARFDEQNNISFARAMESYGIHVAYGLPGLKTHAKTALVVRRDPDGIRRYVHIGTGNYNSKTARIYEDLGVISCDVAVGADAAQLFNHLTGYSRSEDYRTLLVAPRDLRPQITRLIEHEAGFGEDGHIVLKCNSIADEDMVEALYAAGAGGTRIDLLVRGICCLRPGVPGMSENIRVRSVLGRYLEHSRIYRFAHGNVVDGERIEGKTADAVHLIGSADLMPRNLDRRVEVLTPIEVPRHRAWLDRVLGFLLADDVVAWEMRSDTTWERVGPEGFAPHPQERMYRWTVEQQTVRRL
jgi:polyphosphate kinase